jgi:hypothetical protein
MIAMPENFKHRNKVKSTLPFLQSPLLALCEILLLLVLGFLTTKALFSISQFAACLNANIAYLNV